MGKIKNMLKEAPMFCIIVAKEFLENELFYMSNALTYRMIMAFFPFLIFLLSLFRFINYDTTVFLSRILELLPQSFSQVVENFIDNAALSNTIMSVSLLYGIWSAVRGFHAIIKGMNRCSAVEETRNFIVVWISSFILVLVFIAYILLNLVFVVFDEQLMNFLGIFPFLKPVVYILQELPLGIMNWILTVALVLVFYEFTAARKFKFTELMPGAIFTIAAWLVLSWALSLYMKINTNAFYVYGSIAGIFITIFWVNMLATTLLAGAQVNAVILKYGEFKEKYISLLKHYEGIIRGKLDEKSKK